MPDPIDIYLRSLAQRLPRRDRQTARLLAEVEAHLRDSAAALVETGASEAAAARAAAKRFGAVDMIVERFDREAPFVAGPHPLLRAATSLVVAGAGLFALATLVFVNLLLDAGWLRQVAASALALAVLGHGILTLQLIWSQSRTDRQRRTLVIAGGVALTTVGAVATAWSLHLGLATGDGEASGLLVGFLVALQGALAVWAAYPGLRPGSDARAGVRPDAPMVRAVPDSPTVNAKPEERSVTDWHIAQMNVGNLLYPQDDPRVAGFMGALDEINALADGSPGFVWRLQSDSGNATDILLSDDPSFIVNMSVWTDVESLFAFVYKTAHRGVMAQRRQWFAPPENAYQVLWWIEAGRLPTPAEGLERLAYLNAHGPSAHAFGFKQSFPPPNADGGPEDLRPEPFCVGWE